MKHLKPSILTQEAQLLDEVVDHIVKASERIDAANDQMRKLTRALVGLTGIVTVATIVGVIVAILNG